MRMGMCTHPRDPRLFVVFGLLSTVLASTAAGQSQTFSAVSETWIRQSAPQQVFENDLVSVWSNASNDLRHGLVTFDLSSLAGRQIASAELQLFVTAGGSQALAGMSQAAAIVPGTAAGATWASYQQSQAPGLELLDGFRHVVASREGENSYVAGTPASAADLEKIQAKIDGDGLLTLVLRAVEQATNYRKDWGDGAMGRPPRLVLTVAAGPCSLRGDPLPVATQGMPYSASLASLAGCPDGARVRVGGCPLPRGIAIDQAGLISGTPWQNGAYPISAELIDSSDAILDARQIWLYVQGLHNGQTDLDYDGDVDLEDFHTFALMLSGPKPESSACEPTVEPDQVAVDAAEDSWIRQSHPTTVYEQDYVSVWSTPGDLRYGLVSFDVSSLAGRGPLGAVRLELYVQDGGSQSQYPISQIVGIVPGHAANATWADYQANQAPSFIPLDGLRHTLAAGEMVGKYAPSSPASAADRAAIQQVIDGGGLLTLVLKPADDGVEYRKDWVDASHGSAPRLQVLFGSPCYFAADSLPDARAGVPYDAALPVNADCMSPLQWAVSQCELPAGLHLDAATGRIGGTPAYGGDQRFAVTVQDGGGVAREAAFSILVQNARADFDQDGDVDNDDFARFQASHSGPQNPDSDLCWRQYVKTCLDTLIDRGTDRYGPVHTPMLMAVIDVNTLEAPEHPPLYDDDVRTEGRPSHGRWSAGGSNLWLDSATVRTMYRMSQVTGELKYAQAADAYIGSVLERAVKPNGLLYWGSHSYYHAYTDSYAGDGMHEILILHPEWGEMYRVNPQAVRNEIEGIWTWHVVNKETGQHNRHDDAQYGCDFAFSGGSFAIAFAFLHSVTGEAVWMDRARLMADWHWSHRNPETNLVPDAPGVGGRYDSLYCFTSATGPHASQLLRCYELTGDTYFRDIAAAYVKAYDRYGWDAAARNYWGMLGLDGVPVPEQPKGPGYDAYIPSGYVDVWRTLMFSYEFPVVAAETALYAYELSGETPAQRDPELLAAAAHWAELIEKNLPAYLGRRWKAEVEAAMPAVLETGGTYAENYGRTISFFVNMYHATGELRYLRIARTTAREAIGKLFVNGLFKGHPAKPHYQSNDGVGFLLHALMQLDALPQRWRLAF